MATDRITIFDTHAFATANRRRASRSIPDRRFDLPPTRSARSRRHGVGFPVASTMTRRSSSSPGIRGPVSRLGRCNSTDIELVGELLGFAGRPRIHTFIATSDLHLEHKLRITREECIEAVRCSITQARSYTDDIEFSAEDATRSDMDFLCQVVDTAIAAGRRQSTCPNRGLLVPSEVARFYRTVMARISDADNVVFSAHCHDDLGLAVANSLAAILAGVRQVECTINGIGERAGNASLEEVVMAMHVRHDLLPYDTGIDTTRLFRSSRLLSELTGEPVQANKAIVGRNAFAHEAGIHQHGMIQDRRTYEIMRPEDIGVESTLVLGKHSGRHAVRRRCEQLGHELGPAELDRVYRGVIALAERGKPASDDDLEEIVERG